MHEAVTSQPWLSGKGFGDDQHAVVPAAAPGAGVTGVPGRVVDQLELGRRQGRKALADQPDDIRRVADDGCRVAHAGSTFLKGLTLTAAYTPAAT